MKLFKINTQGIIIKRIFLIPVIAIILGITGISYLSSMTMKEIMLDEMRSNSIYTATHIVDRISGNQEALKIIHTMLNKEITVAANMIIANKATLNSDTLTRVAPELGVDHVYWYNDSGKVIYSNVGKYIGWQAPLGHPVDQFRISNKTSFIEDDIRKDSDSDYYGKSGYFRTDNGEFVQVIISAADIERLTKEFSYQALVKNLAINENFIYTLYMDENSKITSHNRKEYENLDLFNYSEAKKAIRNGETYFSEYTYKPKDLRIYDVVVPVIVDEKSMGALNLGYSMADVERAVKINNSRIYILGTFLLGVILFIFRMVQKKLIITPIVEIDTDIRSISLEDNIQYRLPIKEDDPFIKLRRTTNTVLDKVQIYFQSTIEYQRELLATNEELQATLEQLSANEQELMAHYDEINAQKTYIQFLADHDSLTGLQNRRMFAQTLEENIKAGLKGAILLIDIDNFKNINDTLGHMYGDKVLKYVADLLRGVSSDHIIPYRFGGDEFLINIQSQSSITEDTPCLKVILDCFKENHQIEGIKNHISISTGIVRYPLDGCNVEELLMKADIAMYSAKKSGKNQFVFFGEHMTASFLDKIKMEETLRKAIATNGFLLLYQPIIELNTGKIAYFEALIRIQGSNVSPGKFIPIAEESRLILPIGRWVIKEAIRQLRRWIDKGHVPKPIAINLSPKQMHDTTLVEFLTTELKENNIHPTLIEIEITENLLLENKENNIKTLEKIQALGINIALDDFGTGYSSLNSLTYIPVNKVKLDKSLKDQFIYHESNLVIRSLISLIHALELKVVIEGVEEPQEVIKLQRKGGDYVQGYLFSRPIPASDAEKIFDKSYLELLKNN